VVARLSATVHLFYYLTCAPTSGLKIGEFLSASSFSGLHDRFNVAFGTLSFATLPDWAEETPEGVTLTQLGCESRCCSLVLTPFLDIAADQSV
jgi:hypothetical protein